MIAATSLGVVHVAQAATAPASASASRWIQFENPSVFWILALLVPYLVFCSLKSYANLSRRRGALTLGVRILGLTLVVVALAKPILWLENRSESVLYLIDVSDSVDPDVIEREWKAAVNVTRELASGQSAGLILFAGTPTVAIPATSEPWELTPKLETRLFHRRQKNESPKKIQALERAKPTPESLAEIARLQASLDAATQWRERIHADDTNLEAAVRLARAILPEDARRRLIVVSDANETRGDVTRELIELDSGRFSVHTVVAENDAEPDVVAESLIHPSEVRVKEPFDLELSLRSNLEGPAEVKIYRDKFLVATESIELKRGKNRLTVPKVRLEEGFHEFEAVVSAPGDRTLENNTARGAIVVEGRPKVLLIEGTPAEARWFEEALGQEEIRVETRPASGVPTELNDLLSYDVLVLSDVPASAMSGQQMRMIQRYVKEMGGGLIMLGGERSFGLGGYYRTPIEEALPVRMPIRKNIEKPNLAIVLVIDKSGSMGGEKIELAKESSIAAAEVLKPRDAIGVVAFDGAAQWICPMTDATEIDTITSQVARLAAGGGTFIYPALRQAYEALRDSDAKLKHIILLTDGHDSRGGQGYESLLNSIAADDMTLSTVGIGTGADQNLLRNFAQAGSGEFYFTVDFGQLPQIMTRETLRASKSMLIEEPFVPTVVDAKAEPLKGVDLTTMPFLLGYVATSPKPRAQIGLASDYGDPLLASWTYGLGRSVAFTSDAKSRWAGDWIGWDYFTKFWGQVVRSVMHTGGKGSVQTYARVTSKDGIAEVTVDVRDSIGSFQDDVNLEVALFSEAGESSGLKVTHEAPGLFKASFPVEEYGKYYRLRLAAEQQGQVVGLKSLAWTEPYSPEFRTPTANAETLRMLAHETTGVFGPSPAQVFEFKGAPARTPHDTWWWWLVAAVVLLPFDIALRRWLGV